MRKSYHTEVPQIYLPFEHCVQCERLRSVVYVKEILAHITTITHCQSYYTVDCVCMQQLGGVVPVHGIK